MHRLEANIMHHAKKQREQRKYKPLQVIQEEKFECSDCGCFYWVKDRNDFECPNCK
jgi:rubrerythrin